jgi:hypothetical protein
MFNGKYFVIFNTRDIGSGIDRYEILESPLYFSMSDLESRDDLLWRDIASPGILSDQSRRSHIYIRVYDYAGNVTYAGADPLGLTHETRDVSGAYIIVALLIFAAVYIRFYRKSGKIK